MRCSACGTENRPDRKFCASCGTQLAVTCSNCGAANLPDERFCGECGISLQAATGAGTNAAMPTEGASTPSPVGRAPDTAAPVAERRLVSILFADLVEFTTLSEGLDIEAVRELQSSYFEAVRGVVERYGGAVEKYIGDAVMAVWGYPTAHEDDAERAVRAALDVIDAVVGLRERHEIPTLEARASVLTGEAAVTLGAIGEGMVSGDLVNTAARLQAGAAPGTVLVGDATEQAAHDAIAFEPAGERDLKGKALPVRAWQALRIVAGRRGVGRTDQIEAPFVGRAAELRALKDALEATGREGRARYVGVVGQAGIGKSRLAWELEKHVDGLIERVYWHRGRSPAYGEGIAYWALGEMVRARAQIAETDGPDERAAKLDSMLADFIPDDDRRWVEPHLRALLGLGEVAAGDRTEQFAAWRRLFEAISERGTTVLVFEDLHWADDGLLDFIDSLLEWSRVRPILVLALARPELLERRADLGGTSRNVLRLHLEPLGPAEMEALLTAIAPQLPAPVVAAIATRSEGVPLYAIELVRMLRGPDGQIAPTVRADDITIPPSLQALVAARLDALDPDDRSLLQVASVLGQTFTTPGLVEVSGRDAAELEARLRSLARREFVALNADPRSPERGQYGFVQGVIREVAYGTLSRRERRARHLAAARYFEGLGEEEAAPVLATHYLEAYRAAPDDEQGKAIRSQARVALRAAADRAARLHNYDQAVRDLDRALELSEDPAEEAVLLSRQAELNEAGAHFPEAIAAAERAAATFAEIGDRRGAGRATAMLARIELKIGQAAEGTARVERALAEVDAGSDPETYARLAAELARSHMFAGRPADTVDWAERALAAAGPARLVEVIAEALNTRGVGLQSLGRLDEGVALIRAAVELAKEHRLSNAELRARFNLAGRRFIDDPRDAIAVQQTALDVATKTGRRDWQTMTGVFLANSLRVVGDWDEALSVVARIESDDLPPDLREGVISIRAQIAAMRGDHDAWARGMRESAELLADISSFQSISGAAITRTEVALAEGRLADAIESARTIDHGNWLGLATSLEAKAWLRLGDVDAARKTMSSEAYSRDLGALIDLNRMADRAGLAALEGQRDEAVSLFHESARGLRAMNVPGFLADVLLEAAYMLGPDDPEAQAFGEEARQIFERLGARALLDRLDEALATGPKAPKAAGRAQVDEAIAERG